MRDIGHWIAGRHVLADDGPTSDVFDPATGEVTGRVRLADGEDVARAVAAAGEAWPAWRSTPPARRAQVLFAFRELLRRHRDELAEMVTAEHGKTLADAAGEVQRGLEVVEFACGIPYLLRGEFTEEVSNGIDSYSIRQPLGVVAGITPFNFPVMVPMWMFPIAIACGNAFVLKPSERDPSVSLRVAELWAEAGLPDGIFNVVNGDRAAVDAILAHPAVRAVSFVGSTPVARHVFETASSAGKRVQALGGAKNHLVVLPDADLEAAADAAVSAAYGSAGERCMAISVVVAVADVADRLRPMIATRIEELRVGRGSDPDTDMGPLITREHRDRVAGYLDAAAAEGAEVVVDGRDRRVAGAEGGFWLGPSLIDRVRPDMSPYRDEIFGPVLSVVRVASFREAVELVNDNPYGNGTAVFTNDGGIARTFQHDIEVGMVGINVPIPVPMAFHSFGGWKQSLFGDARVHGAEGVAFYSRTKVVTSRWPDPHDRGVDLGFPTN